MNNNHWPNTVKEIQEGLGNFSREVEELCNKTPELEAIVYHKRAWSYYMTFVTRGLDVDGPNEKRRLELRRELESLWERQPSSVHSTFEEPEMRDLEGLNSAPANLGTLYNADHRWKVYLVGDWAEVDA